jgi:hypothetical protein
MHKAGERQHGKEEERDQTMQLEGQRRVIHQSGVQGQPEDAAEPYRHALAVVVLAEQASRPPSAVSTRSSLTVAFVKNLRVPTRRSSSGP